MFQRLISSVLIFSVLGVSNASAMKGNEKQISQIFSHSYEEVVREEIKWTKTEYDKINSWKDFEDQVKAGSSGEEQKIFLAKIKELQINKFIKPSFIPHPHGYSLESHGDRVIFNLMDGTISHGERVLYYKNKSFPEVLKWFENQSRKTSFFSFFISEAHAEPISFLALMIGIGIGSWLIYFDTVGRRGCEDKFRQTLFKLNRLVGECVTSVEEKNVSFEIQELLNSISNGSLKDLVGKSSGGYQTCHELFESNFRYFSYYRRVSCVSSTEVVCDKLNILAKCVNTIKRMSALNSSSRNPGKEGRSSRKSGSGKKSGARQE